MKRIKKENGDLKKLLKEKEEKKEQFLKIETIELTIKGKENNTVISLTNKTVETSPKEDQDFLIPINEHEPPNPLKILYDPKCSSLKQSRISNNSDYDQEKNNSTIFNNNNENNENNNIIKRSIMFLKTVNQKG
jgi:hypothetical protein